MHRLDPDRNAVLKERDELLEIRDAQGPELAPLNAGEVEDQDETADLSLVFEEENV